jgi:hypothetical protein
MGGGYTPVINTSSYLPQTSIITPCNNTMPRRVYCKRCMQEILPQNVCSRPGWCCDVCRRQFSANCTPYPYHCFQCNFDVCQSCSVMNMNVV